MKRNKGFTLIELLVVIAIIGILSAIVLASLGQARAKAQDARIEAQLAGMRPAAEIYFGSNASKYGPTFNAATSADCAQSTSLFGDVDSGMQNLASSTPSLICDATDDNWAAAAPLVSDPATYWCVDSTGISRSFVPAILPFTFTDPSCPAS